jgi:hypothetical protein
MTTNMNGSTSKNGKAEDGMTRGRRAGRRGP